MFVGLFFWNKIKKRVDAAARLASEGMWETEGIWVEATQESHYTFILSILESEKEILQSKGNAKTAEAGI